MKKPHFIIQFACISALLATILLQSFTHFMKMKPLKGFDQEESASVALTFKTYYDGSFQDYMTEHTKQHTGFREFFIRNYNQVALSCFGVVTNNTIVKGYDNEYFLKMYLDEIIGKRLEKEYGDVDKAKAVAKKNVEATKDLVDTLRQYNKMFLFVFAPTKTAVYTEKIPKEYQKQIADFSLEEYYIELFKENDIPHIDFYNYFKAIKDTVTYPLYTRFASHWAESTISFVGDSILKMMEVLGNYKLPSLCCVNLNVTTEYSDFDHEIESAMNLLFPCHKPALPYPTLSLSDTIGKDYPNLLVIGDSYFDQLMFSPFKKAFHQWDFWQYNKTAYSSYYWRTPMIKLPDIRSTLKNADIIMVTATAPMIYNYMYGFLDSVYDLLHESDLDWEEQIQKMMNTIKSDSQWYDAIIKQAKERGISTEENLRNNAIYVIQTMKKNNS